jgi:signal transduction histidine kinase
LIAFLSDANPVNLVEKASMKLAGGFARLLVATALCIMAAPLQAAEPDTGRNSNGAFLTIRRAAWCSLTLLMLATMQATAEPRRVLVLHAFGHAYSPWSDMAESFRAELIKRSPEPIDFYEVSLDTARVQDPKDEGPFVEYIRAVLSGRKLDLLVPVGAPAAFFAQRYRQVLFPTTPMLIVGADVRRIPSATRAENDAVVLLDLDLPAYLKNILHLLPETKDVAVVVGNSPVERFWASELRRDFQPLNEQVNITWFDNLPFGEILERAAAMPPRSAIFWFLLSEDAAGVPYSQDRALDRMREVAVVPIFGMGDYQLGRGIVGGPLMQTSQEAAEVGLRILRGEAPNSIDPPLVAFGAPIYDWRELQRWKIDEALLPHGSIVQFREPTVWQQYRWQLVTALAVVLFQAALIAWLLLERQRRKGAAEQMGRAKVETGHYRESLAHLVRVHAVGEMSAAIAHEINQPLVAIKNYALAARRRLAGTVDAAKVEELLDKIGEQASRAGDVLHSLRTMVKKHESENTRIEVGQLVADTLKLVETQGRSANIRFESAISRDLPSIFVDGVQIQQVVLNLIRNAIEAIEEAGITTSVIKVGVWGTAENEIAVSVTDDGPGICPEDAKHIFEPFYSTKGAGLGVGLSISRAIIEAHGGRISLAPNVDGGCVFQFTLPISHKGKQTA